MSETTKDEIHLFQNEDGNYHSVYHTFNPKTGQVEIGVENTQSSKAYLPPPDAIPVIFIPTFMGTNLKSNNQTDQGSSIYNDNNPSFSNDSSSIGQNNGTIWNMDNQDAAAALWGKRGPLERKKLLNPTKIEVDDDGFLPNYNFAFLGGGQGLSDTAAQTEMKERGWGKVSYFMYGSFLKWLDENMNDFIIAHRKSGLRYFMTDNIKYGDTDFWKLATENLIKDTLTDRANTKLKKYHTKINSPEIKGDKPDEVLHYEAKQIKDEMKLTEDEWYSSYEYTYPVYAFGYNWMESHTDTSLNLQNMINSVKTREKNKGKNVEQVILVTHGSGGLIARGASLSPEIEKNIMGIIHISMPTKGIPEVYRRIKAGSKRGLSDYVSDVANASVTQIGSSEFVRDNIKDIVPSKKEIKEILSSGKKIAIKVAEAASKRAGKIGTLVGKPVAENAYNLWQDETKDQQIDGETADEVCAMAAEAPGFLGMLPFPGYTGNIFQQSAVSSWLYVQNGYMGIGSLSGHSLPLSNDPYTEIYCSTHFWGLFNEKLMNPEGQEQNLYTSFESFSKIIKQQVASFQKKITSYFHPKTFALYSQLYTTFGKVGVQQEQITFGGTFNEININNGGDNIVDFGDGFVPYASASEIPDNKCHYKYVDGHFPYRKAFENAIVKSFIMWSLTKLVAQKSNG